MKTLLKLAGMVTVFLFMSAYAMASEGMPQKYDLDGQLEKVPVIADYTFMGWQKVDNQSFVLQTSPDTYYLIVLSSPSDHLLYGETVSIGSTNNRVRPGYNNVTVRGIGFNETEIINKIYKFNDAAQVNVVEAEILGGK